MCIWQHVHTVVQHVFIIVKTLEEARRSVNEIHAPRKLYCDATRSNHKCLYVTVCQVGYNGRLDTDHVSMFFLTPVIVFAASQK